jgi:hypothetical protein
LESVRRKKGREKKGEIMATCERCETESQVLLIGPVTLCESCILLCLREWQIKHKELDTIMEAS